MAATDISKRVYRPSALVGQVYAAVYGSNAPPVPIGNVLELEVEYKEDVQKQEDMTRLGGGTHAEIRRVTDVGFKAKLADLNVTNLARAVLGTVDPQNAGQVTDKEYTVKKGSLIALPHVSVSGLTVKKSGQAVTAAGNYELRPEGLWIFDAATGVADDDAISVSYSYADQVVIEHLTAKTAELYLRFGGLNEADSGKPEVVDMWRVSQGVTKQLTLLKKGFGAIDVEGTLLQDPNREGVGISRFMRTTLV